MTMKKVGNGEAELTEALPSVYPYVVGDHYLFEAFEEEGTDEYLFKLNFGPGREDLLTKDRFEASFSVSYFKGVNAPLSGDGLIEKAPAFSTVEEYNLQESAAEAALDEAEETTPSSEPPLGEAEVEVGIKRDLRLLEVDAASVMAEAITQYYKDTGVVPTRLFVGWHMLWTYAVQREMDRYEASRHPIHDFDFRPKEIINNATHLDHPLGQIELIADTVFPDTLLALPDNWNAVWDGFVHLASSKEK